MMERYMGEDAFRDGIRRYMVRYAYGVTTTDQLWAELEKVSPRPVTQVAHDFTLRSGVPMILAESAADGGLRLSQSRFATGAERAKGVWLTPVRVAGPGETGVWTGLVSRPKPQTVPLAPGATAIVNAGQGGYFRTLYRPDLQARLAARYAELTPADQLGLLYDARALGEAGIAPIGDFLALARTAAGVEEPVVLAAVATEISTLGRTYPPESAAAYRAYGRARLAPILARIGWDPKPGEADNVAGLRDDVIRGLSELDDADVSAEAHRRFADAIARPESLGGALEQTVQAVAARHADVGVWDELHAQALQASVTRDKSRLYRLLGSAQDPALVDRALTLALSGEPPPTIAPTIIAGVAGLYPDKAFDFALAHRTQVEAFLEQPSRVVYFTELARGSRDAAMLKKLDAFARTIPASSLGEVRKAQAEIRHRRAFAKRLVETDRWLTAHPG
jgi:aminopeptidase N